MKCRQCFYPDTRVVETREEDSGVIRRRRECTSCLFRFTTHELPPSVFNAAKHQIKRSIARSTGEYATLIRSRKLLKPKMIEDRLAGMSCEEIAEKYKLPSVHMARYYTKQPRINRNGSAKTVGERHSGRSGELRDASADGGRRADHGRSRNSPSVPGLHPADSWEGSTDFLRP